VSHQTICKILTEFTGGVIQFLNIFERSSANSQDFREINPDKRFLEIVEINAFICLKGRRYFKRIDTHIVRFLRHFELIL
jgi:hypothetical protein